MAEGSSPDDDDDEAIPWIASSKSSDQKFEKIFYTSIMSSKSLVQILW